MKDKPFFKLVILWIAVAALVIGVKVFIIPRLNIEKQPVNVISENPDERCVVTYAEGTDSAGALGDYDATGEYVFFSYSDRTAVVDAYDLEGNFAFRIHLENKDNGGIRICCQDEFLYVDSKYNNVFVFDGDTLIRKMTNQEAREHGYTGSFFTEPSKTVAQRWLRFYRLNDDGSLGPALNLPISVTADYYKFVVPFVVIPILWVLVVIRKHRKEQQKAGSV